MKKLRTITKITLICCVLVFLMTILDYLALHDIRQDYLSRDMIEYFDITFSEELPDWTTTNGEWKMVEISLVSRFFFYILVIIVLVNYMKKAKYSKNSN